jgi:hypothetical protein
MGDYEKDYVVWPIPLEATIQVQMKKLDDPTWHELKITRLR